jgi:hypothetical protein
MYEKCDILLFEMPLHVSTSHKRKRSSRVDRMVGWLYPSGKIRERLSPLSDQYNPWDGCFVP